MEENAMYLKIGSYTPPDENGKGEKIDRDWYRQGWIFKDEDAFRNRPDDVCYIPELSDVTCTRRDILEECGGHVDLAEIVFEELDWQHVSTLLGELEILGEASDCNGCGKAS